MARLPTYGDYVIQHPAGVEGYDPRIMPMSAAIRYTAKLKWFLLRGVTSKRMPLAAQFPALAKKLMGSGHYYGPPHCDGSASVAACAAKKPGFGSPEVWRRIGTVHHIEVVTADLAKTVYP